jgi:2-dehydropantoate 2-reductase
MVRIAVFGAGAIGCWVGGRLAAGGAQVTLIGRARVLDELRAGVRTTELDGPARTATPELATEARAAATTDVVLVTVKSQATAEAGRELAAVLAERATVISLQNGVRNVSVLHDELHGRRVLAGMVPFNVVRSEPGAYHRASEGELMVEHAEAATPLVDACRQAALGIELRDDMQAVQWSKLLLNLNNAINALSGQPLATELANRDFRRCLAAAMREALDVLDAAHQPVARVTLLPAAWIARLLPAPDRMFRALAGRVLAIDPRARSSMASDLDAGRATEIDYIQGEIVALAHRNGRRAPVNETLVQLVRDAQHGGQRAFTGAELLRALSHKGISSH